MDINTVLSGAVVLLISIVAYFLQRLVKTLDKMDSNVTVHTTQIATIQQQVNHIPDMETKLEKIFVDFTVLRNQHEEYKVRCSRNNPTT